MRKKIFLSIFLVAGCVILLAAATQADTVTFTNFVKFSGNGPDTVDVVATIEDIGTNTVQITMDATSLVASQKLTGWYFNVTLSGLAAGDFEHVSSPANVAADLVKVDYNDLKADGDGYFDILFEFSTSGIFGGGSKSVYTVTHTGLDAGDFIAMSDSGGGQGIYYSVVKESPWWGADTFSTTGSSTPVPEPATMLLLGAGLLGLWAFRRKFKK